MTTATRITLAKYDRMIAEGAFNAETETETKRRRIELIDGELRPMSPIGPVHEDVVDALTEWSVTCVPPGKVRVRVQNSIGIPELDSAPEPDVAWVERRSYRSGRPLAANILLIIEVADSSLAFDRGAKAELFAAANVEDYWVVNIPDRCVEVFRDPRSGRYQSHDIFNAPAEVHPLAFPQLALPVASLFPPGA